MKRSEMVDKMINFYLDHANKIGYGWSEKDFMDNLLADMEIDGMLPPKIELGDSGFVNTVEILDYTELDYEVKWEPEDE